MSEHHELMGGKLHIYKRERSGYWQASAYLSGRNHRISTKEDSLARAKDIAEVLKLGADINAGDPEGYTPLMYAANLGLVENVKTLLQHGADATRKTKNGITALALVEDRSSVNRAERAEIAQLLKQHLAAKDMPR